MARGRKPGYKVAKKVVKKATKYVKKHDTGLSPIDYSRAIVPYRYEEHELNIAKLEKGAEKYHDFIEKYRMKHPGITLDQAREAYHRKRGTEFKPTKRRVKEVKRRKVDKYAGHDLMKLETTKMHSLEQCEAKKRKYMDMIHEKRKQIMHLKEQIKEDKKGIMYCDKEKRELKNLKSAIKRRENPNFGIRPKKKAEYKFVD